MVQWVPWTCCIDSDLLKLNFFHQCIFSHASTIRQRLIFIAATLLNDMTRVSEENNVDKMTTVQGTDGIWQTARSATALLMVVVENMSGEAGIHALVGYQVYRLALMDRQDRIALGSPLFWLESLLPRQALPLRTSIASFEDKSPSLAWGFAVTMLFPDFLVKVLKLSDRQVQEFSIKISAEFFASTMELLKEARSSKKKKHWEHWEDWPILTEQLMTIYLLTTDSSLRQRLHLRFYDFYAIAGDRMLEARTSKDIRETCLGMKDASCRFSIAINGQGWDHLQKYTLHWLDWLQEGSNISGEIMMNLFHMKTLCRIAAGLQSVKMKGRTERGGLPYHRPEKWVRVLIARAFDEVENLSNQSSMNEAVTFTEFAKAFKLDPPPTTTLDSTIREVALTSLLLDSVDRAIARSLQRTEFNMSKPFKILPLPKHLKDTLGSVRRWDEQIPPEAAMALRKVQEPIKNISRLRFDMKRDDDLAEAHIQSLNRV